MSLDPGAIDQLYRRYGFKKQKSTDDSVRVYSYRADYFLNADIVPLTTDADAEKVRNQFQNAGFACTIRTYKSTSDASTELFKGFFAVSRTRQRAKQEHERFTQHLTTTLGAPYEYVPARYSIDGVEAEPENPIIRRILDSLAKPGPRLVLLEAAAGYGKTCTAYEVLRHALADSKGQIPLLTELSRNRQAKIFRYVLLDEIDRNFPSLNYELVKDEIHSGRILVIVDGFDELLHRANIYEDYQDAEPMLETIGELLTGDAKILLTTRRAAIFAGDNFHQWMDLHTGEFAIHRFRLERPTVTDWLGPERTNQLEEAGVPLAELSNPVLLAFLRSLLPEDFALCVADPDTVVDRYFSSLLDREQERQELRMDIDEQLAVFRRLAIDMVDEDFTAESREYLLLRIMEENAPLLSRVRERYSRDARPTSDDLAAKLVAHALLDRRGDDEAQIGFVNDFVLGSMVGDNVLDANTMEWTANEQFIDLAVTAYGARSGARRNQLWEKLRFALSLTDASLRLSAELVLQGRPCSDYTASTFEQLSIDGSRFGENQYFADCVFVNCMFTSVAFVLDGFRNATFVNCQFYQCFVDNTVSISHAAKIYVVGCISNPMTFLDDFGAVGASSDQDAIMAGDETKRYERRVMEQFWPRGRPHFTNRKALRTLYRGIASDEHPKVTAAIDSLRKKGLLTFVGDVAEINTEHLQEIQTLLHRELAPR